MIDLGMATLFGLNSAKNSNNSFDPSVELDTHLYCSIMKTIFEEGCLQDNILEIWKFDEKKLKSLTKQDIIDKIQSTTVR